MPSNPPLVMLEIYLFFFLKKRATIAIDNANHLTETCQKLFGTTGGGGALKELLTSSHPLFLVFWAVQPPFLPLPPPLVISRRGRRPIPT